jgi:hypothetical protein
VTGPPQLLQGLQGNFAATLVLDAWNPQGVSLPG